MLGQFFGLPANISLLVEPSMDIAAKKARRGPALPQGTLPRGLSREEAAAYVGVSPTTFDAMIKSNAMPKPKHIGRRRVWDRRQIDLAFEALPDENDSDDVWGRAEA